VGEKLLGIQCRFRFAIERIETDVAWFPWGIGRSMLAIRSPVSASCTRSRITHPRTVWNLSLFPAARTTCFADELVVERRPTSRQLAAEELLHWFIARSRLFWQMASAKLLTTSRSYPRALPQYNLGHAERLQPSKRCALNFRTCGRRQLPARRDRRLRRQSLSVAAEILSRIPR